MQNAPHNYEQEFFEAIQAIDNLPVDAEQKKALIHQINWLYVHFTRQQVEAEAETVDIIKGNDQYNRDNYER